MSDTPNQNPEPAAAFAKMWSDSCSRLMQAAMSYSPETAPPELLRQIRGGLMQALTQSWQEYLRSPQFLEGMKQMMDQAVAFRKFSAEVLTKTRHATEGVAHDDIQSLRAVLSQMESRLARQMDALSAQISPLEKGRNRTSQNAARPVSPARKSKPSPKEAATKRKSSRRKSQI